MVSKFVLHQDVSVLNNDCRLENTHFYHGKKVLLNEAYREFPGGPVVARIRSLVRELRSRKLCGTAEKKAKKKKSKTKTKTQKTPKLNEAYKSKNVLLTNY